MKLYLKLLLALGVLLTISFNLMLKVEDKAIASIKINSIYDSKRNLADNIKLGEIIRASRKHSWKQ